MKKNLDDEFEFERDYTPLEPTSINRYMAVLIDVSLSLALILNGIAGMTTMNRLLYKNQTREQIESSCDEYKNELVQKSCSAYHGITTPFREFVYFTCGQIERFLDYVEEELDVKEKPQPKYL